MKKTVLFSAVSLCLVLAAMTCRAEVLVDQLDDTERSKGFVTTQSHIDGSEVASAFKLKSCAVIRKITWSGIIKPNEENLYPFAIRIYSSQGLQPAKEYLSEFTGTAEMAGPGGDNNFPYVFSYTLDEDFYVAAGTRYWISIQYAGALSDNFHISIEKNKTGTLWGHGGAGRRSDDAKWLPTNFVFPFPYILCRGYSIEIEGELLADADCPVIAE